jgi:hypothetical protein
MLIVEKLVEWRLAGETEVLGENLPQRHFVHHKSHMTRPGFEPLFVLYSIIVISVRCAPEYTKILDELLGRDRRIAQENGGFP